MAEGCFCIFCSDTVFYFLKNISYQMMFKKKQIYPKKNQVQIIFNSAVDKELQSMLLPLNLMQKLRFLPKYCVKNNCLTANNLRTNIISLCWVVLCVFPFTARAFLGLRNLNPNFFSYTFVFCDLFLYCFAFLIVYILNIIHTKDNIAWVLAFQDIARFFNTKITFKVFTKGNWIGLFMIVGFYIIFCITDFCVGSPWSVIICSLALFCFDASMVYAIRIISWLETYVVMWNEQVLQRQNSIEKTANLLEMLDAYNKILKCSWLFKKCYQHLVLIHTLETFLHGLMDIKMFLTVFLNHPYTAPTLIMSFLWIVKNLFLQTLFCIRCEIFYTALRKCQDSCTVIVNTDCTDDERKLCRNIWRLNEAKFSKMSLCGVVTVDAMLPLGLFGLLTNYTVVLIQSALL